MATEGKSVKQGRKNSAISTQKFLPFGDIRDGYIQLKNGGLRAVLKCSSINFNLKSENEQKSLISGYQGFLNTLDFPIQILIRSKRLDIDNYIESIDKMAETQKNSLIKGQTVEYAVYVKKLVEYANIMEKQFYVIVPVDEMPAEKRGLFEFIGDVFSSGDDSSLKVRLRLKSFDKQQAKIKPRVESIVAGLSSMGVEAKQLDTVQIIELLYQIYNPDISRSEKGEHIEDQDISGI